MREKSKIEKYAEKWFKDNSYEFKVLKYYISKTVYFIKQGDFETEIEIPWCVTDLKGYMKMVGETLRLEKALKIR